MNEVSRKRSFKIRWYSMNFSLELDQKGFSIDLFRRPFCIIQPSWFSFNDTYFNVPEINFMFETQLVIENVPKFERLIVRNKHKYETFLNQLRGPPFRTECPFFCFSSLNFIFRIRHKHSFKMIVFWRISTFNPTWCHTKWC